jgi:hypothetical protein
MAKGGLNPYFVRHLSRRLAEQPLFAELLATASSPAP